MSNLKKETEMDTSAGTDNTYSLNWASIVSVQCILKDTVSVHMKPIVHIYVHVLAHIQDYEVWI